MSLLALGLVEMFENAARLALSPKEGDRMAVASGPQCLACSSAHQPGRQRERENAMANIAGAAASGAHCQAGQVARERRQPLGRSPRKNCKNDLDDQT